MLRRVPDQCNDVGIDIKPRALLRAMTERQGMRITARDVEALRLAIETLEAQDERHKKSMHIYGDTLGDLVTHKSTAGSLIEGLRVLLEVHT